jgi:hypothetical protein
MMSCREEIDVMHHGGLFEELPLEGEVGRVDSDEVRVFEVDGSAFGVERDGWRR